MTIFMRTTKESIRFTEFLDRICKELNIDKSVALHFINYDLERICNDRFPIDNIQLSQLENEIKKRIKTETELQQEIEKKESIIKKISTRIDSLTSSLKEKTELLSTQEQKVSELQTKLNALKEQLKDTDKKKKLLDYDVMMKNHSVKEMNDKPFRYLKLFLVFISILAIIIVTILIYYKK